jgi:excinuclease ABC subunit A
MSSQIVLEGVRVNNLQNLTLQIPHRAITVLCGLSGSGKSSLAFDTLYAEGQRRYVETFSTSARQFLDRLERPAADRITGLPPAVAIHQQATGGGPRSTVGTRTEILDALRTLFAACGTQFCPACGLIVESADPESGAMAILRDFRGQRLLVGVPAAGSADGPQSPAVWLATGLTRVIDAGQLRRLEDLVSFETPEQALVIVDRLRAEDSQQGRIAEALSTAFAFSDQCRILVEAASDADAPHGGVTLVDGAAWWTRTFSSTRRCSGCGVVFHPLQPECLSFTSPLGACGSCRGTGENRQEPSGRARGRRPQTTLPAGVCQTCAGSRLSSLAAAVRWNRCSLSDVCRMELLDFSAWLEEQLGATDPQLLTALTPAAGLIRRRLQLMLDIGLGYLSLERSMDSLSGGEARRTLLAAVLGSGLTGTLYVLDEPTQGLHSNDTRLVLQLLRRLQQTGNTVVVVEHDPAVILAADHVVELGPGAGAGGGRIVFSGLPADLLNADTSTGLALRNRPSIAVPETTAKSLPVEDSSPKQWLRLTGVCCHNLQQIDVEIPLGVLCAVTGVSGSGKSSLLVDTLVPALRKQLRLPEPPGTSSQLAGQWKTLSGHEYLEGVLLLDQQPLKRSLRSIPATWLGVWSDIRGLLAETHEARRRNYPAAMFSFNAAKGGRCPVCEGRGQVTVPMQFLADIDTPCSACGGHRFLPEILEIRYRDRGVHEILQMTCDDAFRFFHGQYRIQHRLNAMKQAGLAYLPLGQPLSTVSGGEAQRLRIAAVLAGVPCDLDPATSSSAPRLTRSGRTLFVLDEPSCGLHPADVDRLVECLQFLLQTGHSILVIDHDLRLLQHAQWEIRLGPGPGRHGGKILRSAPPN